MAYLRKYNDETILRICDTVSDTDLLIFSQHYPYYFAEDFWSRRAYSKGYISDPREFFNTQIEKSGDRYLAIASQYDSLPGAERYNPAWRTYCPEVAGYKGDAAQLEYFLNIGGCRHAALIGLASGGRQYLLEKYLTEDPVDDICVLLGASYTGHLEFFTSRRAILLELSQKYPGIFRELVANCETHRHYNTLFYLTSELQSSKIDR